MSLVKQFQSGFGDLITQQYAKCIEFSGDLDVSFDEYSQKLLDSLTAIHGELVVKDELSQMITYINGIHNNDLYLAIGLCKGNETAWSEFDNRFNSKIIQYALLYTKNESQADDIKLGLKGSLFLESPKTGKSKIASFNGRGSLSSWLKVVIFRDVLSSQKESKVSSLDSIVFGIEDESLADDDMKNLEEIVAAGFKQLSQEEKSLLRDYFILKKRENELANRLEVHVSTISRRLKKICDELLNHFNRIADEKYGLDKDQFKELLNQFDQSWQNSIAKILG